MVVTLLALIHSIILPHPHADAVLAGSSTVLMNYYKNLYSSESHRVIECNSWALFEAQSSSASSSSSSSCNDSDSELLRANDNCPGRRGGGGGQIRPLVSHQTSVVRSKSRNLSLENDFTTITVENVTELRQQEEVMKIKRSKEDGKQVKVEILCIQYVNGQFFVRAKYEN